MDAEVLFGPLGRMTGNSKRVSYKTASEKYILEFESSSAANRI